MAEAKPAAATAAVESIDASSAPSLNITDDSKATKLEAQIPAASKSTDDESNSPAKSSTKAESKTPAMSPTDADSKTLGKSLTPQVSPPAAKSPTPSQTESAKSSSTEKIDETLLDNSKSAPHSKHAVVNGGDEVEELEPKSTIFTITSTPASSDAEKDAKTGEEDQKPNEPGSPISPKIIASSETEAKSSTQVSPNIVSPKTLSETSEKNQDVNENASDKESITAQEDDRGNVVSVPQGSDDRGTGDTSQAGTKAQTDLAKAGDVEDSSSKAKDAGNGAAAVNGVSTKVDNDEGDDSNVSEVQDDDACDNVDDKDRAVSNNSLDKVKSNDDDDVVIVVEKSLPNDNQVDAIQKESSVSNGHEYSKVALDIEKYIISNTDSIVEAPITKESVDVVASEVKTSVSRKEDGEVIEKMSMGGKPYDCGKGNLSDVDNDQISIKENLETEEKDLDTAITNGLDSGDENSTTVEEKKDCDDNQAPPNKKVDEEDKKSDAAEDSVTAEKAHHESEADTSSFNKNGSSNLANDEQDEKKDDQKEKDDKDDTGIDSKLSNEEENADVDSTAADKNSTAGQEEPETDGSEAAGSKDAGTESCAEEEVVQRDAKEENITNKESSEKIMKTEAEDDTGENKAKHPAGEGEDNETDEDGEAGKGDKEDSEGAKDSEPGKETKKNVAFKEPMDDALDETTTGSTEDRIKSGAAECDTKEEVAGDASEGGTNSVEPDEVINIEDKQDANEDESQEETSQQETEQQTSDGKSCNTVAPDESKDESAGGEDKEKSEKRETEEKPIENETTKKSVVGGGKEDVDCEMNDEAGESATTETSGSEVIVEGETAESVAKEETTEDEDNADAAKEKDSEEATDVEDKQEAAEGETEEAATDDGGHAATTAEGDRKDGEGDDEEEKGVTEGKNEENGGNESREEAAAEDVEKEAAAENVEAAAEDGTKEDSAANEGEAKEEALPEYEAQEGTATEGEAKEATSEDEAKDDAVTKGEADEKDGETAVDDKEEATTDGEDKGESAAEVKDESETAAEGEDKDDAASEGEDKDDAASEGEDKDDAAAEGEDKDDAAAEGEDKDDAVAEGEDKDDAAAAGEDKDDADKDDAAAEGEDKDDAAAEGEDKDDAAVEGEDKDDAAAEGEDKGEAAAEGEDKGEAAAEGEDKGEAAAEGEDKGEAAAEGEDKGEAAAEGEDKGEAAAEGEDKGEAAAEGEDKGEAAAEGEDKGEAAAEGEDKGEASAEGEDRGEAAAEGEDKDEAAAEGEDKDEAAAEGEDKEEAPAEGADKEDAAVDESAADDGAEEVAKTEGEAEGEEDGKIEDETEEASKGAVEKEITEELVETAKAESTEAVADDGGNKDEDTEEGTKDKVVEEISKGVDKPVREPLSSGKRGGRISRKKSPVKTARHRAKRGQEGHDSGVDETTQSQNIQRIGSMLKSCSINKKTHNRKKNFNDTNPNREGVRNSRIVTNSSLLDNCRDIRDVYLNINDARAINDIPINFGNRTVNNTSTVGNITSTAGNNTANIALEQNTGNDNRFVKSNYKKSHTKNVTTLTNGGLYNISGASPGHHEENTKTSSVCNPDNGCDPEVKSKPSRGSRLVRKLSFGRSSEARKRSSSAAASTTADHQSCISDKKSPKFTRGSFLSSLFSKSSKSEVGTLKNNIGGESTPVVSTLAQFFQATPSKAGAGKDVSALEQLAKKHVREPKEAVKLSGNRTEIDGKFASSDIRAISASSSREFTRTGRLTEPLRINSSGNSMRSGHSSADCIQKVLKRDTSQGPEEFIGRFCVRSNTVNENLFDFGNNSYDIGAERKRQHFDGKNSTHGGVKSSASFANTNSKESLPTSRSTVGLLGTGRQGLFGLIMADNPAASKIIQKARENKFYLTDISSVNSVNNAESTEKNVAKKSQTVCCLRSSSKSYDISNLTSECKVSSFQKCQNESVGTSETRDQICDNERSPINIPDGRIAKSKLFKRDEHDFPREKNQTVENQVKQVLISNVEKQDFVEIANTSIQTRENKTLPKNSTTDRTCKRGLDLNNSQTIFTEKLQVSAKEPPNHFSYSESLSSNKADKRNNSIDTKSGQGTNIFVESRLLKGEVKNTLGICLKSSKTSEQKNPPLWTSNKFDAKHRVIKRTSSVGNFLQPSNQQLSNSSYAKFALEGILEKKMKILEKETISVPTPNSKILSDDVGLEKSSEAEQGFKNSSKASFTTLFHSSGSEKNINTAETENSKSEASCSNCPNINNNKIEQAIISCPRAALKCTDCVPSDCKEEIFKRVVQRSDTVIETRELPFRDLRSNGTISSEDGAQNQNSVTATVAESGLENDTKSSERILLQTSSESKPSSISGGRTSFGPICAGKSVAGAAAATSAGQVEPKREVAPKVSGDARVVSSASATSSVAHRNGVEIETKEETNMSEFYKVGRGVRCKEGCYGVTAHGLQKSEDPSVSKKGAVHQEQHSASNTIKAEQIIFDDPKIVSNKNDVGNQTCFRSSNTKDFKTEHADLNNKNTQSITNNKSSGDMTVSIHRNTKIQINASTNNHVADSDGRLLQRHRTASLVPRNGESVSPGKEGRASPRKRHPRSVDPSPMKRTQQTAASVERKKLPMNKIEVGKSASPNLKQVKSKIGSLNNTSYRPGGGNIKIESKKLDFSKASSRIAAKNEEYKPGGGDKKIESQKLKWSAQSKVGSLENKSHRAGGGDKKIESRKLNFKDGAQPKVGSRDNIKHKPGGGEVQIQEQKLDFKQSASSKVGSMNNVTHRPGGGDKKIFDDKDYLRQKSNESRSPCKTPSSMQGSECGTSRPESPEGTNDATNPASQATSGVTSPQPAEDAP